MQTYPLRLQPQEIIFIATSDTYIVEQDPNVYLVRLFRLLREAARGFGIEEPIALLVC